MCKMGPKYQIYETPQKSLLILRPLYWPFIFALPIERGLPTNNFSQLQFSHLFNERDNPCLSFSLGLLGSWSRGMWAHFERGWPWTWEGTVSLFSMAIMGSKRSQQLFTTVCVRDPMFSIPGSLFIREQETVKRYLKENSSAMRYIIIGRINISRWRHFPTSSK